MSEPVRVGEVLVKEGLLEPRPPIEVATLVQEALYHTEAEASLKQAQAEQNALKACREIVVKADAALTKMAGEPVDLIWCDDLEGSTLIAISTSFPVGERSLRFRFVTGLSLQELCPTCEEWRAVPLYGSIGSRATLGRALNVPVKPHEEWECAVNLDIEEGMTRTEAIIKHRPFPDVPAAPPAPTPLETLGSALVDYLYDAGALQSGQSE